VPALDRLEDAARGSDNVLPPILESVTAYATVGEISDRLRTAFGVHRELITV
jgi:methylmalonyl-CoA mutase N-terminal domain/subunit